jgi:hypothetical protein
MRCEHYSRESRKVQANSAGARAQDAFGSTQGVRLLLPFGEAWLSYGR